MNTFLMILHVLVCLVLILVVLLQRGKGSDIGAAFGGGGGNTVFGARGAGNFLTKMTTGAAITFMATSLSLSYFSNREANLLTFDEEVVEEAAPSGAPEAENVDESEDASADELIEIEDESGETEKE